jgi:osmotically inducible lipoprotein OsmB
MKLVVLRQAALASLLALALAGCGETRGERALTGGAIGAGAGAVGGALLGYNPLTGAIVGGAAGAVGGAVTAPRECDDERDRPTGRC